MNKLVISIICVSLSLQTSFALGQEASDSLYDQFLNEVTGSEESSPEQDLLLVELPEDEIVEPEVPVESEAIVESVDEEEGNSRVLNDIIVQAIEESQVVEPVPDLEINDDGKFDYIRYNSLRDAAKHDVNLPGTSNHILKAIEFDPSLFAGVNVSFYRKSEGEISGMGPLGNVQTDSSDKRYFNVTNTRSQRRRNTILSVTYERVVDVTKEDKIFDIDLMLFIHSDQDPRENFFRKINISVDWTEKVNGLAKVTFNRLIEEVPLSETNFEMHVEVATQKLVMIDRNYGIIRVAPVTLGAIDARTTIDGVVNSMTLLLPGVKGEYSDFSFKDSVIMKRSFWSNGGDQNTESRTRPSYYKGRPFIGVIDRSRIAGLEKDERDNYVMVTANEVNYKEGYRQIGFHYQIEDSGLVRGYESHGCLRLQDHDLYVLDDILNKGPKDYIQVEVTLKLDDSFDQIDSIYRRQRTYDKVVYSRKQNSPRTVFCKNKPSYPVRFFDYGYHTVADSDCLSQTTPSQDSIENVVAYLTGKSNQAPVVTEWSNAEHHSIRVRKEFLDANYQYLIGLRPEFVSVDDLTQQQQIEMVDVIKQFQTANPGVIPGQITVAPTPRVSSDRWPYLSLKPGQHPQTIETFNTYAKNCPNKLKRTNFFTNNSDRPGIGNCEGYYNALTNAGVVTR